jgi:hypothetical protein
MTSASYKSMLSGSLVTMACRVLRLRMEKTASMWRGGGVANILNKQLRTTGRGWFSSLVVGRGLNILPTTIKVVICNL